MSVIYGIRYPGTGMPQAGSHSSGLCCEQCRDMAIEYCIVGDAKPDEALEGDAYEAAQLRVLLLARIRQISSPISVEGMRFLLTGAVADAHIPEAIGDQNSWRMALAYLIDFSLNHYNVSSLRYCRNYTDRYDRESRENVSFSCRDCSSLITAEHAQSGFSLVEDSERAGYYHLDPAVPRTVCRACFDGHYTYLSYEDIYLRDDAQIDCVSVVGIDGDVTLRYAEENFYLHSDGGWYQSETAAMPEISLLNYTANPFDHFSWDERNKPNALVFGIELEMEPIERYNASEQRRIIQTLGGNVGENFILKSDGSLGAGVELVTMPFTLAQHLDGSGVPWAKILPPLYDIARAGAGTDAAGIHIHINKKALSALTVGKMLMFLNDPGLAPLITTIAQRPSGSFCSRSAKKLTDGTRSSENRYDIMNVSVRHPTCEIRMFKGNLTVERLYKNIEFCHALVQYCRQASMRTLCEWGQFSRWLIAHRGQYQHLVRFLIDKQCVGFRQLATPSRDGQVAIIDR